MARASEGTEGQQRGPRQGVGTHARPEADGVGDRPGGHSTRARQTHWLSGSWFRDPQARPHHRDRLVTVPTAHHRTLPCHAAFGARMPAAHWPPPPPKGCARAHRFSVHLLWELQAPVPSAGSQHREGPDGCGERSRTTNKPTAAALRLRRDHRVLTKLPDASSQKCDCSK